MNEAPIQFGDYQILGEIARGGMGVVHQAFHGPTNRYCALKLLRELHLESSDARTRFHVEAQAASRLRHPNIVEIRHSGEVGGIHFIEMELIEGISLAERLAGEPLDHRTAVRWIAEVARAVQCAHHHGVLHRDIKPGNVLIDSNEVAKLTDFGMARILDQDSDLTQTVSTVGTPAYMAPELARGGARNSTVAADVYGLGAILYQVLGGQPPYQGESAMQILLAVQDASPPRLSTLQPHIPRDLEVICERAMQREVSNRFDSAGELANELERWLRGEPIRSSPVSVFRQAAWWIRRHPALASLSAALFVAITAGYAMTEWQRRAAKDLSRQLRHQLSLSELSRAGHSFDQESSHLGLARLAAIAREDPDNPSVAIQLALRMTHLNWPRPAGHFGKDAGRIQQITPAPNGEWVATGAETGFVHLWNPITGELLGDPLFHETGPWTRLNFHPDSRAILSLKSSGNLRVWSSTNGTATFTPILGNTSTGLVHEALFYPIHPMMLIAAEGQPVRQLHLRSGEMRYFEGTEGTRYMALDGRAIRLATSRGDGQVQFWNPFTREPRGTIKVGSPVTSLALGGVERHVAVGTANGELIIYNLQTGQELARRANSGRTQPAFALDGKVLIHEPTPGNLAFAFDPDFSQEGSRFPGVTPPWGILLSKNQRFLLHRSASDRLLPRVLSSQGTPGIFAESIPREPDSSCAAFLLDPSHIAVSKADGGADLWRINSHLPATIQHALGGGILAATFTPDDRAVHLVRQDGRLDTIQLSDLSSRTTRLPRLRKIRHATFSRNGRRLATASPSGITVHTVPSSPTDSPREIRVRMDDADDATDDASGNPMAATEIPGGLTRLLLSPEGNTLAIADQTRVRFWNVEGGRFMGEPVRLSPRPTPPPTATVSQPISQEVYPPPPSMDLEAEPADEAWAEPTESDPDIDPLQIEFSPNGQHVLLLEPGHPVHLIETANGSRIPGPGLEGSPGCVPTIARWLPDGQRIAVATSDGSVHLWNPFNSHGPGRIMDHPAPIRFLDFDPKGHLLMTVGRDRIIRIWDVATAEILTSHPMRQQSFQAALHPSGGSIQSAGGRGLMRVVDAKLGINQTKPIHLLNWGTRHQVQDMQLSPSGDWTICLSTSGQGLLIHSALPNTAIPKWVPDLAEAIAGYRITRIRSLEAVPADNYLALVRELESLGGDDYWHAYFLPHLLGRLPHPTLNPPLN